MKSLTPFSKIVVLGIFIASFSQATLAQTAAPGVAPATAPSPLEVQIYQYEFLSARGADELVEFDRQLDAKDRRKDAMLQESASYSKLWAGRILREQRVENIVRGMIELSSAVRDPSLSGGSYGTQKAAAAVEDRIFRRFQEMKTTGNAGALAPLADAIMYELEVEVMGTAPSKTAAIDITAKLKQRTFKDWQEEVRYLTTNRGRVERARRMSGRIPDAGRLDAELAEVANSLQAEWKTAMTENSKPESVASNNSKVSGDRAPAAYGPSAGSTGNITGREFPSKLWAMTYDDGPAGHTDSILNELAKRQIKATFFWLARNAPNYKSAVARAKSAGHELANHSWSHAQLTKVGNAQLDREIVDSTRALEAQYGTKVKVFRLPYGSGTRDSNIRTRIANAGLTHIFWTVDTLDWQDRNPTSIYNRTMKQVNSHGRGVILFHDVHAQTVVASAKVMDEMRSQGVRWVTVSNALDIINGVAK